MHLVDQRVLGIGILALLGTLVAVKRAATGSVVDRPEGNLMVQFVNAFNLFFLLVVNPLAAILLITRQFAAIDPAHVSIADPRMVIAVELTGFVTYVTGFFLMAWALLTLGRSYQLGGSAPRSGDEMVTGGPYRLVRHPMYTAALSISLGLACLVQSWVFFCVFCAYAVLVLLLIPMEEDGLRKAYGERYRAYERNTKKVVPFAY